MKNPFVSSTIILLTGGFLSKFLGFFLKIIITRYIGVEGIGLYSLLMPTFSLFIVIATFSFPISISKLVATPKKSSKNIIFSIIPISLLMNLFIIILLFFISKPLAYSLLKEGRLYYPLICIGLTLPFIGLSSIVKGYYWGKQRMGPYILSNIVEQIVRLIILILIIPLCLKKSLVLTVSVIVLVNIVSEISSIIVMILFLPKGTKIKKSNLIPKRQEIKEVLNISVPSTSSKIIGSVAHFVEPIIITNVLLYVGYSKNFVLTEYGILNGYVFGLLLLPQFFTQSVSTSLIPELSKYHTLGDTKKCKKRIKQIVLLSLAIGLVSTLLVYIFPSYLLNLLYGTTKGINYIKILGPFTLLYFIDTPLSNALQALNKSKESMFITLIGSLLKLIILTVLSFLKIGLLGLIIATIINLIFNTIIHIKIINKVLN